jgi:hypothetical protein
MAYDPIANDTAEAALAAAEAALAAAALPFNRAALVPMAVRCDTLADVAEWQAWTGRAPDLIHAFAYANTWSAAVTAVQNACSTFAGKKLEWALQLAAGSQTSGGNAANVQSGGAMSDVIAGTWDSTINYMLDMMLAHNPTGRILIRPGWEAGNFTPYPWGATSNVANSRTNFIAAFQRVSGLIRAKSDRFKIVWCVAHRCEDYTGASVNPLDPSTGFDPGAAYYDAVGVDMYLIGNDVSNGQTFDRLSHTSATPGLLFDDVAYGLRRLADHARANNKEMVINEWGAGADRPDFIRAMAGFIADPANRVIAHGFWNKNAAYQSGSAQYQYPCRLSDASNNYPLSKKVFKEAFFDNGTTYVEQSETPALIARTTAPAVPSANRAAIDGIIQVLRAGGLLPYIDFLALLAGPDNVTTLLNPLGAGGFTTSTPRAVGRLAVNGAPTFVANRGWRGTGNIADFLRASSVKLSTALTRNFAQNDAHMSAYFWTADANAGAQTYDCGVTSSFIGRNAAGTQWIGRANTAGTVTLSNAGQDAGHVMWQRTAAGVWTSYFDGVASRSGADASIAPSNDDLRIGAIPAIGAAGGGVNQIGVVTLGRAIPTATPFNGPLTLRNAIAAYMQRLAAITI